MTTFNLITPDIRGRACAAIMTAPEGYECVLRERKAVRSSAQQGLQWMWYTDIAKHTGESKEEVHERYKARFLVPIFERDDRDYADMMAALRDVWKSEMKGEARALNREIVRLTSTTKASVEQMAEYLTDIERDCVENGIPLRHPDDLYREALHVPKTKEVGK